MRLFRFIITILLIMAFATQLNAQSDAVERGFQTSADNVYGVLVGFLAIAVSAFFGFFMWVFRKLFNSWDAYKEKRATGDEARTGILESLLAEQKLSNAKLDKLTEIQTGQAGEIEEINKEVHQLKDKTEALATDLEGIKTEVSGLKDAIKNA